MRSAAMADKNRIICSVFLSWVLPFLLTDALATKPEQRRPYYYSQLGERPPELLSRDSHWLNATRKMTLTQLKGQVVWLQFNF
ncbi:MAG: hypothetical protein CMJ75_12565 [Planctomycetaceae bacterium]|nr:hypothetical protein [Planctomycetaceae bacterium]